MAILGFVLSLLLFILIGLLSTRKADGADSDYLLAGQTVSPVLAARAQTVSKLFEF